MIIKVLRRYNILYLWQSSRDSVSLSGFCPQFHLELKHTSPLVVTRYCDTVDGQQHVRPGTFEILETGLAGARPLLSSPLLCQTTQTGCATRRHGLLVENCWITREWLLKTECWTVFKMLLAEESHAPRLSSGPANSGPGVARCALNTAVIDGRAHCCLPWFTSWSCLWFPIAHTSLCARQLGPKKNCNIKLCSFSRQREEKRDF